MLCAVALLNGRRGDACSRAWQIHTSPLGLGSIAGDNSHWCWQNVRCCTVHLNGFLKRSLLGMHVLSGQRPAGNFISRGPRIACGSVTPPYRDFRPLERQHNVSLSAPISHSHPRSDAHRVWHRSSRSAYNCTLEEEYQALSSWPERVAFRRQHSERSSTSSVAYLPKLVSNLQCVCLYPHN